MLVELVPVAFYFFYLFLVFLLELEDVECDAVEVGEGLPGVVAVGVIFPLYQIVSFAFHYLEVHYSLDFICFVGEDVGSVVDGSGVLF